jgi:hypothetical protein
MTNGAGLAMDDPGRPHDKEGLAMAPAIDFLYHRKG